MLKCSLYLISSGLCSFWLNLCSVWVWRSERLGLGSVHVGVLANWWTFPSGCDHPGSTVVLVSSGSHCGLENWLGRGRISHCGILFYSAASRVERLAPEAVELSLSSCYPLAVTAVEASLGQLLGRKKALSWAYMERIDNFSGGSYFSLLFPYYFFFP